MTDDHAALAANRANWDERVPAHLRAYGVESFLDDRDQISSVVAEDLTLLRAHLPIGTPLGLTLVHLQCHIGLNTPVVGTPWRQRHRNRLLCGLHHRGP